MKSVRRKAVFAFAVLASTMGAAAFESGDAPCSFLDATGNRAGWYDPVTFEIEYADGNMEFCESSSGGTGVPWRMVQCERNGFDGPVVFEAVAPGSEVDIMKFADRVWHIDPDCSPMSERVTDPRE